MTEGKINPRIERYEVGKVYRVPCVKTHWPKPQWTRSLWIPILMPAHADDDLVEGIGLHYHYDFRFIRKEPNEADYAYVEGCVDRWKQEVKHLVRKCYRSYAGDNYPNNRIQWFPRLQEKYKCERMKNNICPHRGVDLSGCGGLTVTCPAHGLIWNRETGALVEVPNNKLRL